MHRNKGNKDSPSRTLPQKKTVEAAWDGAFLSRNKRLKSTFVQAYDFYKKSPEQSGLCSDMVRPSGFEPLAFRLGGGRSILLSYGRMV